MGLQNSMVEPSNEKVIIKADDGWHAINWRELWQYRELFFFLVWRDVKTRYSQSALGFIWAIVPPIFGMLIFTIVFGRLAKINSDGVPYAIFSFSALVPWGYFSGALTGASGSLTGRGEMISKVYIPRLIIPVIPALAKLIDFALALVLLVGLMVWFQTVPTKGVLVIPFLILLMMLTATGIGMWLTALAIQYRDVKYGLGLVVQMFQFATPVIYPTSLVPESYRLLYALNPMVGVIEGFRSALLNTNPMPWDLIWVGTITAVLIAISGVLYFQRTERIFSDVI